MTAPFPVGNPRAFMTRYGPIDLGERPDGGPHMPQTVTAAVKAFETGWEAGRDSLEGEFKRGVWHGVIVSAATLVLVIILRLLRSL